MANPIPAGLALNEEEQEAFHGMNRRERLRFNALPDNGSKHVFIQALVEREKTEREKSVRLAKRHYSIYIYIVIIFTKPVLVSSSFPNTAFSLGL